MVVSTHHYYATISCYINCNRWKHCHCPICLYFVLKIMQKNKYETILVISLGCIVLFFWLHKIVFLYIAASILFLALISKKALHYIDFVWYKIAEVLGYVNSRIILGILFYFILTPIAWLSKIFQKKSNSFKVSTDSNSTFVNRNYTYQSKDFDKMW